MTRPRQALLIGLSVAICAGGAEWFNTAALRAAEPLIHAAYVWQRTWNGPAQQAIGRTADRLSGFVVLAAELDWQRGIPRVIRVALDYPAMAAAHRPIG